jgi:hypothetical protein
MTALIRYTAAVVVGGLSFLGGQVPTLAAESPSPVPSAPSAPPPQSVQEVPSEPTLPRQRVSPEASPNSPAVS